MKVGVDIDNQQVTLEIGGQGGLTTTVRLDPKVAQFVANQIIASADSINKAISEGLINSSDD